MSFAWTEDSIATLEKLWAQGETCSQIAKRLGSDVTRNAVIGKVRRLGLSFRSGPCADPFTHVNLERKLNRKFGAKPSPRRNREPGSRSPQLASPALDHSQPRDITPLASDPPEHERVALLDLKHGQCKWPLGYPAMFCGRPTCARGSGSYCTDHAARAFAGTGRKPWAPDDSRRAVFAARARQTFNVAAE